MVARPLPASARSRLRNGLLLPRDWNRFLAQVLFEYWRRYRLERARSFVLVILRSSCGTWVAEARCDQVDQGIPAHRVAHSQRRGAEGDTWATRRCIARPFRRLPRKDR